jgi:hypothetical protein
VERDGQLYEIKTWPVREVCKEAGCQDQAADGVALEPDARERPTGRPRSCQVYSSTG